MPVVHAVSHAVCHRDGSVGSLPRHFTGFQGSEEPLESFGFTLFDPFGILQTGLISALLLCCFKLMLHRLLQEFKGAVVPELHPMVMGVEKLAPSLIS